MNIVFPEDWIPGSPNIPFDFSASLETFVSLWDVSGDGDFDFSLGDFSFSSWNCRVVGTKGATWLVFRWWLIVSAKTSGKWMPLIMIKTL